MTRAQHYFTLELIEWLPPDKYSALLACTVDGRSSFNRDRKVNTFLISLSNLVEAERVLGRRIRLIRSDITQVEGTVEEREKWKLSICVDANQRIIVVILNNTAHPTPFEYIDFVWKEIRKSGTIEPRDVYRALEQHLKMSSHTFYGSRGNYHAMYYWPVVALKWLGLVGQNGTGPLCLTQEGVVCRDWKDKIGAQYSVSESARTTIRTGRSICSVA